MKYLLQMRATGMTRLMSLHCRLCHDDGKPTKGFFGVEPRHRSILSNGQFEREVWIAFKRHMKETHRLDPRLSKRLSSRGDKIRTATGSPQAR